MTYQTTLSKKEELERFKRASSDLVRRAEKDRNVAREFLREIGYFEIMSQPDPGPFKNPSAKAKSHVSRIIKPLKNTK